MIYLTLLIYIVDNDLFDITCNNIENQKQPGCKGLHNFLPTVMPELSPLTAEGAVLATMAITSEPLASPSL